MKVTYNYNIQCCLTAAAKAFALSLFAIPPASAQPSDITAIISAQLRSTAIVRGRSNSAQQHLGYLL